jgi:ferredoxin-thioredoxin reductase catalytic subunit
MAPRYSPLPPDKQDENAAAGVSKRGRSPTADTPAAAAKVRKGLASRDQRGGVKKCPSRLNRRS